MADLLALPRFGPPLQLVRSHVAAPAPGHRPLVTVHLPCDTDLEQAIADLVAARHHGMASHGTGSTHVLTVPTEEDRCDR